MSGHSKWSTIKHKKAAADAAMVAAEDGADGKPTPGPAAVPVFGAPAAELDIGALMTNVKQVCTASCD